MKKAAKLFLILISLIGLAFVSPKDKAPKQINVVIDAGHGGSDVGTMIDNLSEKQIVERIIAKIQTFNKNKNIIIHFTRSEDKFIPLKDRTDFINTIRPDLVLSLHVNASANPNTSGLEFYVSKDSKSYEKSAVIAEKFQTKFTASNWKVNEIKTANYHILQKSEVPAVLMEIGYLSNKKDQKLMENNTEQNQIAKKIISCIAELK